MRDFMADALSILAACLVIAAIASAIILFRPAARRRRRHRRHTRRPKINLFKAEPTEPAPKADA